MVKCFPQSAAYPRKPHSVPTDGRLGEIQCLARYVTENTTQTPEERSRYSDSLPVGQSGDDADHPVSFTEVQRDTQPI
jgi:hypothetical protein